MKILGHSFINRKGAFLNGKEVVSCPENEAKFLRHIYKALEVNYPKFYKMDTLSKSVILADFILSPTYTDLTEQEDKLQLLFANDESSKRTDLSFIESYVPKEAASPSLFVYTLPNILTGELSIKHKWYGENTFFILEKFNAEFYLEQIRMSFSRGNEYCLCGWIGSVDKKNEECFLFLLSKSEGEVTFNELENILNTYRNE
jgi:hypothetical protein